MPLPSATDTPPLPGFDPVPLRYRVDGWTPERQRAYVEHLAETLCPETAAALVGMSAESVRRLRRRPGSEGLNAACDAALRKGLCERGRAALIDEAVNGRLVRRILPWRADQRGKDTLAAPSGPARESRVPVRGPRSGRERGDRGRLERLDGAAGERRTGRRLSPVARPRRCVVDQFSAAPRLPGSRRSARSSLSPPAHRGRGESGRRPGEGPAGSGAEARDAYFGFKPARGVTHRRIRSKGGD